MSCSHARAWPSADHEEGWYCPECLQGVNLASESSESKPAAVVSTYEGEPGNSKPETQEKSSESTDVSVTFGKSWQKVYRYYSHGRYYFKFMWGQGDRILGQRHIPGGNVQNQLAQ